MKSVSRLFVVALLSLCFMPSVSAKGVVGLPVGGQPSGVSSPDAKSMVSDGKVYDYEFKKTSYGGRDWYKCILEDVIYSIEKDAVVTGGMEIYAFEPEACPQIYFNLITGNSEKLAELCNKSDKCENGLSVKGALTLGNNEVFIVETAILWDSRRKDLHGSECIGACLLVINFTSLNSKVKSMSGMTERQKVGYVSQQLRKYNIKKLQIENFSVDFDEFPTAATISSMFDTLAEKTGNDLFHYKESATDKFVVGGYTGGG